MPQTEIIRILKRHKIPPLRFIRYLRHAVQLCLLVLDLLFDELFFLLAQIHLIHLDHQLVPSLFLLDLFGLLARILRLDIGLDTLSTLSCAVRWLYLLTCGRWLLLSSRLLLLLLSLCDPIYATKRNA